MTPVHRGCSGKMWVAKPTDDRVEHLLGMELDVPHVVRQLLVQRGMTTAAAAQAFLNPTLRETLPNPSILAGMDTAVDRIVAALESGEKIAIFGDYDVDGATSTALLRRYFEMLGTAVTVYIPDRHTEGYGPSIPAFEHLAREGHTLLITVDCGTTAFAPFERAHELGLDCIIVDHHKAEARLPAVVALVNPCRLDAPTPELQHLAAVGLAFMLTVALQARLRSLGRLPTPEPDLRTLLDIVAVGTVADVVKLVGVNRTFVTQGLRVLHKRLNVGLTALCDVAQIAKAPDAYHLGFVLGPRINAGGRVGQADLGTRLLSTHDPAEAARLAHDLNLYNQERQAIEAEVLSQAIQQVESQHLHQHPFLLVGDAGWHQGVIGIVASRLKERYQKPTAVISYDDAQKGKASGRSVDGVDLGSLIHKAKHQGLLEQGGGHAMAVGFALHQAQHSALQAFLNESVAPLLEARPVQHSYDLTVALDALTVELATVLEQLGPFGMGNPTPKFRVANAAVDYVQQVGKDHLKCRLMTTSGERVEAMAFRALGTPLGDRLLGAKGQVVDLIGTLRKDTWLGREKATLLVDDVVMG